MEIAVIIWAICWLVAQINPLDQGVKNIVYIFGIVIIIVCLFLPVATGHPLFVR